MLSVLRGMLLGVLAVTAFSCATGSVELSDHSRMQEPAISRRQ